MQPCSPYLPLICYPPTPVPSLPLVSRQHACIYTMHAAPPLQTCSAPQACTTAAWGLLALLQLPPSAVPVYIVYPIVHTCYNLVHIYTCTSMRASHLTCTTPREPQLVHISCVRSCTHQAHLPSRWTWTIPLATVTFWPSALSISRS